MMVLVGAPIAGPDMNLYITLSQSADSGNDRIPEIGSLAVIGPPRVEYFYGLTTVSS